MKSSKMPISVPSYTITASIPTPIEHKALRKAAGLTAPPLPVDSPAYRSALCKSVLCLVARTPEGDLIGMVRLIGDGGLVCQVCDMTVHPNYQRQGIGKAMFAQLAEWIEDNCPEAYVSLIGDAAAQPLYRAMGLVPTVGIGMWRPTEPWLESWCAKKGMTMDEIKAYFASI